MLETIGVLVLPSEKEGLGRVMLEAMALEKPVVAFDSGGPREVIRSGDNGILVNGGDLKGLAEAIVTVLTDPALAESMGTRARETAVRSYSSRAVMGRLVDVYAEICADMQD